MHGGPLFPLGTTRGHASQPDDTLTGSYTVVFSAQLGARSRTLVWNVSVLPGDGRSWASSGTLC